MERSLFTTKPPRRTIPKSRIEADKDDCAFGALAAEISRVIVYVLSRRAAPKAQSMSGGASPALESS
jgi:hypothetical protein